MTFLARLQLINMALIAFSAFVQFFADRIGTRSRNCTAIQVKRRHKLLSQSVINKFRDPWDVLAYRYCHDNADFSGFVYNLSNPILSSRSPISALIIVRLGPDPVLSTRMYRTRRGRTPSLSPVSFCLQTTSAQKVVKLKVK